MSKSFPKPVLKINTAVKKTFNNSTLNDIKIVSEDTAQK